MKTYSLACCAAAMIVAAPASAKVTTLDFNSNGSASIFTGILYGGQTYIASDYALTNAATGNSTVPSLSVAVGDEIKGEVSFTTPVTTNPSENYFNAYLALFLNNTDASGITEFKSSYTFQMFDGAVDVTPAVLQHVNGSAGFLAIADYTYSPVSSFTFDRIEYDLTFTELVDIDGNDLQSGVLPADTALLQITTAAAAVPEPTTWAMMVGGFGLIGGAMRRRQSNTVKFA